jgi:hypothetical protein
MVLASSAALAVLLGLIGGLWGRTPAGNTALVVPFAGGPAIAAGAWTALTLALHFGETGVSRLWLGAVVGGVAALIASLVAIFLPIVTATSLPPALSSLASWAADVLAALLGFTVVRVLGYRLRARGWLALGVTLALAAALVAFVPGIAAILNLVLLPVLVVLPLLVSDGTTTERTWGSARFALTWLAVLIVVVVGLQVGGYLVSVAG